MRNCTSYLFASGRGGAPAGGHSYGRGFAIAWQRGPIDPQTGPNGAYVEDVLEAAKNRLDQLQRACPCAENAIAFRAIELAQRALDRRGARMAQEMELLDAARALDAAVEAIEAGSETQEGDAA